MIQELVDNATRPLYLFDNDPDGLTAFLLLYKKIKGGKAIPIKTAEVGEEYLKQIETYAPDVVFILDKPLVDKTFVEKCKTPALWIDHHEPQKHGNITYLNPLTINEEPIPTSALVYNLVQEHAWLAVVGIIADWQIPNAGLLKTFNKNHPELKITPKQKNLLYNSEIGELAQVFSFALKGSGSDVRKHIKVLTRINSPEELLNEKTPQARLIMRHYKHHKQQYEKLLEQVKISKEDFVVFTYSDASNSYTTDLANEILYKNPKKTVVIARLSNGSYKCSLRSTTKAIDKALHECLEAVGGTGGGHEHACGAVIPEDAFVKFIQLFREKTS